MIIILIINQNMFQEHAKHILPADLKKSLYDECKKNAKIAHDKINCRGISRSDFILC